jgi:cytochrome b6-f complex iron-sulfur subunit
MQRRHFIGRAALGLASLVGAMAAFSWIRQFFPRLAGKKRRITITDPEQFPVDTYTYLDEHKLYIYRDHEGLRAVSAVCTHLGCILERTTDGFECPCHGSCYNDRGEVMSGPAPRDLSWFSISGGSEGRIIIDPGEKVDAGDKYLRT